LVHACHLLQFSPNEPLCVLQDRRNAPFYQNVVTKEPKEKTPGWKVTYGKHHASWWRGGGGVGAGFSSLNVCQVCFINELFNF
jgi:hypothetical protein